MAKIRTKVNLKRGIRVFYYYFISLSCSLFFLFLSFYRPNSSYYFSFPLISLWFILIHSTCQMPQRDGTRARVVRHGPSQTSWCVLQGFGWARCGSGVSRLVVRWPVVDGSWFDDKGGLNQARVGWRCELETTASGCSGRAKGVWGVQQSVRKPDK